MKTTSLAAGVAAALAVSLLALPVAPAIADTTPVEACSTDNLTAISGVVGKKLVLNATEDNIEVSTATADSVSLCAVDDYDNAVSYYLDAAATKLYGTEKTSGSSATYTYTNAGRSVFHVKTLKFTTKYATGESGFPTVTASYVNVNGAKGTLVQKATGVTYTSKKVAISYRQKVALTSAAGKKLTVVLKVTYAAKKLTSKKFTATGSIKSTPKKAKYDVKKLSLKVAASGTTSEFVAKSGKGKKQFNRFTALTKTFTHPLASAGLAG